jgi:hypothetical protein
MGELSQHLVKRRRVNRVIWKSKRLLLRWFNRRGGNRRLIWAKFNGVLQALRFPKKNDFNVTSVL